MLRARVGAFGLLLTTGGTGVAPRDVTPEATRDVLEKEVPGLTEEIRRRSAERTVKALGSRAVAGTVGTSLVLNLPGRPEGAVEAFEFVADARTRHLVDLLATRAPVPDGVARSGGGDAGPASAVGDPAVRTPFRGGRGAPARGRRMLGSRVRRPMGRSEGSSCGTGSTPGGASLRRRSPGLVLAACGTYSSTPTPSSGGSIGPAGGTVAAGPVTLVVAPGALLADLSVVILPQPDPLPIDPAAGPVEYLPGPALHRARRPPARGSRVSSASATTPPTCRPARPSPTSCCSSGTTSRS